jgi:hypothetical protein
LSKNYELTGVFQGFGSPGYPLVAEFATFCRFAYDQPAEFKIDIALYDEAGQKVTDSIPRTLTFTEMPTNDLITAWRIKFPQKGVYSFKVFCNNLNLGDFKIYCR